MSQMHTEGRGGGSDEVPISNLPPGVREARWLKRSAGLVQPDIVYLELEGHQGELQAVVWKTYAARPWLERQTFGRWFTRREAHVMSRLAAVRGCPPCLGRPHPWTLAMEACPGEKPPRRPDVAERVGKVVEELHAHGVTHGDIHRRNILWDPRNHQVWLVDYTQSLLHPRVPIPLVRRVTGYVFRQAVHIDRVRLAELKRRWAGRGQLNEEERELLDQPPWYLRWGRGFRKGVYKRLRDRLKGR